jgi:UDP-glucuronate 4-epimerase
MILVTGSAGFIGMHASLALLDLGQEVFGVDNMNSYYQVSLKEDRLKRLTGYPKFKFLQGDLADTKFCEEVFDKCKPTHVLHLAAQAGVRYSLENPATYIQANIVAFGNVLESCRKHQVAHLVYASSSSVYGANSTLPFSTTQPVELPVSLYAATKKSNELMAHVYSHLFNIPTTGLRFFTVYGPWGRPDMSPWLFTSAILEGRPIKVFNNGDMERDFTFIDDIISGILSVLHSPPNEGDQKNHNLRYAVYNIGNNRPVKLLNYIKILESEIGIPAKLEFLPMQPGDMQATFADIEPLRQNFGFDPRTELATGIAHWVDWFMDYHALTPTNKRKF